MRSKSLLSMVALFGISVNLAGCGESNASLKAKGRQTLKSLETTTQAVDANPASDSRQNPIYMSFKRAEHILKKYPSLPSNRPILLYAEQGSANHSLIDVCWMERGTRVDGCYLKQANKSGDIVVVDPSIPHRLATQYTNVFLRNMTIHIVHRGGSKSERRSFPPMIDIDVPASWRLSSISVGLVDVDGTKYPSHPITLQRGKQKGHH